LTFYYISGTAIIQSSFIIIIIIIKHQNCLWWISK